jgi:hypothetical protein
MAQRLISCGETNRTFTFDPIGVMHIFDVPQRRKTMVEPMTEQAISDRVPDDQFQPFEDAPH